MGDARRLAETALLTRKHAAQMKELQAEQGRLLVKWTSPDAPEGNLMGSLCARKPFDEKAAAASEGFADLQEGLAENLRDRQALLGEVQTLAAQVARVRANVNEACSVNAEQIDTFESLGRGVSAAETAAESTVRAVHTTRTLVLRHQTRSAGGLSEIVSASEEIFGAKKDEVSNGQCGSSTDSSEDGQSDGSGRR